MKSDLLALYVISAIWSDNMTFALESAHQGVYKLFLVLDNVSITKGCVNHGFDIVLLVEIIISNSDGIQQPTEEQLTLGDIYPDGQLNVIDIVGLVNIILDN